MKPRRLLSLCLAGMLALSATGCVNQHPEQTADDGSDQVRIVATSPAAVDICDKLDIATPVVLPQHFVNFVRFHNCRFYEHDFVESFPYDRLVLEDCKD